MEVLDFVSFVLCSERIHLASCLFDSSQPGTPVVGSYQFQLIRSLDALERLRKSLRRHWTMLHFRNPLST